MASLFGIENADGTQAVSYLQQTGFIQPRQRATLILFSRVAIPDQWRRPHLYQFNPEFQADVEATLDLAKRQPVNDLTTLMLPSRNAKSAILPEVMGQQVSLHHLSDQYRFLLIIDNDAGLSPISQPIATPSRSMFSGWVTDEPVTRTAFTANQYTPNPAAIFTTTHHTHLVLHQIIGAQGTYNRIDTTADFDYLVGATAQNFNVSGETLMNLKPGAVANSITADPMNKNLFSVAANPVAGQGTSLEIPSELNAPAFHLQKIIGSLVSGIKYTQNEPNDLVFGGDDVMLSTVNTLLNSGGNTVVTQIKPNQPFSMGELMQLFPDLHIEVIELPFEAQYEQCSPAAPTRRNVFTSVLSTSLPGLLAQFGLSEVQFRYNSSIPKQGAPISINSPRGVFQIFRLATLYPTSEEGQTHAWNSLQQYLEMILFPIIKENGGEFDVLVHCSLTGASLIDLNFLDDGMPERGLVESNNLLGGLNTPLVGQASQQQSNAAQLYNVIRQISATTPMGPMDGSGSLFGLPPY